MARYGSLLLVVALATPSLSAHASERPIITAPLSSRPTLAGKIVKGYTKIVERPAVQRGLRAVNAIGYGGMSLVFATGAVAPFAPGEPHLAGTAARLVAGTFATLFATTSITMAAPKTMDRHLWQPLRRLIGTERAAK